MKKKKLLFLIFITMLFFAGNKSAFAKSYACESTDCKDEIKAIIDGTNESTKLACSYTVKYNNEYYANIITYDIDTKLFTAYSTASDSFLGTIMGNLNPSNSPFIDDDALENLKNMNRCPRYSYVDFTYTNEICFDSDGSACNKIATEKNPKWFRGMKFGTKEDSKLIDDKISEYKNYDNTYNGSCNKDNELAKQYDGFCRYINTDLNAMDYILVYYNSNSSKISVNNAEFNRTLTIDYGKSETFHEKSALFTFIYNYENRISGLNSCPSQIYALESDWAYSENSSTSNIYIYAKQSEISKDDEGLVSRTKTYTLNQCSTEDEPKPSEPEKKGCELIPSKIIEYINDAMSYIKIGVPILLAALIIIDFASALFASSEDKMKKAQGKAVKRIIIAIIIFFVPTLINMIFNIVNDVWSNANYEICGLDK